MRTDDPMTLTQAQTIYRQAALFDLVRDFRVGLNLAFYRTFAVPRIASLLVSTGEIRRQPHKRSIDTGLFMYELIENGLDSPRGERVVDALNAMHRKWQIEDEDYIYVLATFVVVPTRWIGRYGPRRLSEAETTAISRFYRELGCRMDIPNVPASYESFAAYLDTYESKHVRFSPAGEQLMEATKVVMASQLPGPLKPLARGLTRLVLEDRVAKAVGLRPSPRVGRLAMRCIAALRRGRARHRALRPESWFVPGRVVEGVYPQGYDLNDLGPSD